MTVYEEKLQKMISMCCPYMGLDASGLMRAVLVERQQTGKRYCECIAALAVQKELIKLLSQLERMADES